MLKVHGTAYSIFWVTHLPSVTLIFYSSKCADQDKSHDNLDSSRAMMNSTMISFVGGNQDEYSLVADKQTQTSKKRKYEEFLAG